MNDETSGAKSRYADASSTCGDLHSPKGISFDDHEFTRKSGEPGCAIVSLLGRRSGIKLLSGFSYYRHHFCSDGNVVTIWANWDRPDVRAHVVLWGGRDHSQNDPDVSGHCAHGTRVRSGSHR